MRFCAVIAAIYFFTGSMACADDLAQDNASGKKFFPLHNLHFQKTANALPLPSASPKFFPLRPRPFATPAKPISMAKENGPAFLPSDSPTLVSPSFNQTDFPVASSKTSSPKMTTEQANQLLSIFRAPE